ncbi:MAG TPA: hypothetical protein VGS10_15530 [Terracidiphilus sp.]|nr:hypothetical protein [Terracidiphilus sp.]
MAGKAHLKPKTKTVEDTSRRIPTSFTCPDCQGTLFLVSDHEFKQFRCRIGHLYSPESKLDAQSDNVERLMWSATRALEEQAEYTSQLAGQVARTSASLAREYKGISRSAQQKAGVLRQLIEDPPETSHAHARKR